MKRVLLVLLLLWAPLSAQAQDLNLARLDHGPNNVQVRSGFEYAFAASLGYARATTLLDRDLVVRGDVTVPWAGFDLEDYQVRAGMMLLPVGSEHWKLAVGLSPSLRGMTNEAAQLVGLGLDVSGVGGYYAVHGFLAAEFGFDWALSTHVEHKAPYRAKYADAKDGWYAPAGGNLRAGLQGGPSLGMFDLILRLGYVTDIWWEGPMLPFYATLAVNTRF